LNNSQLKRNHKKQGKIDLFFNKNKEKFAMEKGQIPSSRI